MSRLHDNANAFWQVIGKPLLALILPVVGCLAFIPLLVGVSVLIIAPVSEGGMPALILPAIVSVTASLLWIVVTWSLALRLLLTTLTTQRPPPPVPL